MTATTSEYPIIFKPDMVKAILEGRKTQTRRILELPKWSTKKWEDFETDGNTARTISKVTGCFSEIICPYGKTGDNLYVRETWQEVMNNWDKAYIYAADYPEEDRLALKPWKPPIHMPRAACRLRLKIKDIRIERIKEISEEDAIAEGCLPSAYSDRIVTGTVTTATTTFATLWAKIHGWNSWLYDNPYVWVIEFAKL